MMEDAAEANEERAQQYHTAEGDQAEQMAADEVTRSKSFELNKSPVIETG